MTKREENKFTMLKAVLSNLEANGDAVNSIAGFQQGKNDLAALIGDIEAREIKFNTIAMGKTPAKRAGKEELMKSLRPVLSGLYIYGKSSSREDLKALADVSDSKIKSLRDTLLYNFAKSIRNTALPEAVNLADYGVTQEKLDDLTAKMDEYSSAFSSKESAHQDKSAAREALKSLFSEADKLLVKTLDKFAVMFKDHNPEFYSAYKSARVIRDLGLRKATTGEPTVPVS